MKNKTILTLIFLSIVYMANSQSKLTGSGKQKNLLKDSTLLSIEDNMNYFPSCFRKIDSGKFNGVVSGKINFKTHDHEKQNIAFTNVPSLLQIEYDKSQVYDNSFKTYHFKSNGVVFSYTTYFASNKLIIIINGKQFVINVIDGDCHSRILGIDFKYTTLKTSEILTLWVSKPVGLFQAGKRQSSYNKDVLLLPGTKLVFTIERKPIKEKE
jgi:hypothetical protein